MRRNTDPPYVELHLHTAYSLLDGASLPEELVLRAAQLGYRALAITDHDTVSGVVEFGRACEAVGIQPITGAEITLADGSHLTLLCTSRQGYANLCRVLTRIRHGEPPAPVPLEGAPLDPDAPCLADFAEGLLLLTGCRSGQLAQAVDAGHLEDAIAILRTYVAWFGAGNVYVELQHNAVFGDTRRVAYLATLARRLGVRSVATGNVHYHDRARGYLQDVLVAIRTHTTLDGSHRDRQANREFALRRPETAAAYFGRFPEAVATTREIAGRCAGFIMPRDIGYEFPRYAKTGGASEDAYLARVCQEAFRERYPAGTPREHQAWAQLQDELRLVAKHGLAGFFLTYRDLLIMAREEAAKIRGYEQSGSRAFLPPGRGRGSAVSSVICYLIGLSPVDPLRHNLYIGRFLNEEMTSIPDIDIDFPREIRAAMIERIRDEYGVEHAAMVGAFATYRLPSAVRDIGKALGMDPTVIDRVARLCEHRAASALGEELAKLPEFADRLDVPPWSSLIALAEQLSGFPRHMTQHSGGIVISSQRLDELVPIQPAAMEGRSIIQWDKDTVNDLGVIKIDFLALGMLSQVEECLALIDDHRTDAIDLSRIDYDDPAVFAMIQEGDTIGTFQIESRAQIQMVRRTLPASLDDLVVQVAIVRPGPIIGGAVTPFVERRRDPGYRPTYDHPSLEPVLRETLGVVLYQEQVIQVAEVIAGFTAGQADQLRRAMTKKRSAEAMAAMRDQFLAGAAQQEIGPGLAAEMFAKLEGFASYGFPKSHAAAFALLAYQTSWLKHYYPAEFLCALLNNQPMGFYDPAILINDAKRHGIRVLRPDINDSMARCSVEGRRTVRIGLMMVKAVSEEVADEIIRERLRGGPYRSLSDLFRRIPLRRDVLEALIAAGACDRFGLQRREMLWQVGLFIPDRSLSPGRKRRKTTGRQLAFELPVEQDMTTLPPTSAWYRVEEAYRVLGFSLAQHPIALLRHQLPSGMATAADLETMPNGMPVALPGLVAVRQRPETAKGITFMLLEDETGLFNVIVYPDLYERQRLAVRGVPFLVIEGRLQRTQNNINIIATTLTPIARNAVEPDARRGWQEHQDDRHEEADVRTLVFVHDDARISEAEIRAVQPRSHNYR